MYITLAEAGLNAFLGDLTSNFVKLVHVSNMLIVGHESIRTQMVTVAVVKYL